MMQSAFTACTNAFQTIFMYFDTFGHCKSLQAQITIYIKEMLSRRQAFTFVWLLNLTLLHSWPRPRDFIFLPPGLVGEVIFLVASVCLCVCVSVWVYSGYIIHHYTKVMVKGRRSRSKVVGQGHEVKVKVVWGLLYTHRLAGGATHGRFH